MEQLKIYETILLYRKKQGLTQEELADMLGVTNQAVSKWESAQCCPDIVLLPEIADIFGISIDELFGRAHKKEIHYDLCSELPWNDDSTIRIFKTLGKKILQTSDDSGQINITFPESDISGQILKVEVFGNMSCDSDINGDIIGHGDIKCNQINGDVSECRGNITCNGRIDGDVNSGNNVFCHGSINGDMNCGNNLNCGGSINGDVKCGGNIECKRIEGDIE